MPASRLTHRRYNSSVAFITGHEDPHKDQTGLNWEKLATGVETLVFLMGYKNLPANRRTVDPKRKTSPDPGGLDSLGDHPGADHRNRRLGRYRPTDRGRRSGPPAILVVGSVVELREHLSWFERRPLFGKQIVITRTREQASDLVVRLENLGAACLEFPTIRLAPPTNWEDLDRAIHSLASFDWILFTSPNGVEAFFNRLMGLGLDLRDLKGPKIGAIGPATALALKEWKLRADLVPEKFQAEYILEALAPLGIAGKKVLIPRAEQAREVLPEGLRGMGAQVVVAAAYQTLPDDSEKIPLLEKLQAGTVHCLTFTSSSTVLNFLGLFDRQEILTRLKQVIIACIGPITAQTARDNGLKVDIIPESFTIPALVEAIRDYYQHPDRASFPQRF